MKVSIIALFMLAFLTISFAEDYVVINSMDGRDVLSGIFYANAKGLPVKFMPVPGGNADIFAAKIGSGHNILLIQGNITVSSFVENNLRNRNNTVEVYNSVDGGVTNLELAKRSGTDTFIIVDSSYSDGALSVLPYAAKKKAYVILANKNNIAQVKDIVNGKKVIIYGLVDAQVKTELASLSPEIIGKGEDKYEDNLLIVDRMMKEFSINRTIIADGSFVEDSMVSGEIPIMLSGRLVPQPTYTYIKQQVGDNKLSGVLLIGNELVVPIYDMRARMEKEFENEGLNKSFGIMVKFAQGIPSGGGTVLALDRFPLPTYKPNLNITEVVYNNQTGKIMISVDNIGEGSAYYTMDVHVRVNNVDYKAFGGGDAKLIERGEQQGTEYPLDLSSVSEGSVTTTVLVKYGSSKKSLEEYTLYEGHLTTISYIDRSNVSVQYAKYDKDKKTVMVTIKNSGNETAYAFTKLSLVLGGVLTNISGSGTKPISPGSLRVEDFPLELSEQDLAANKNATVYIDYGGRQGFLLKHAMYIVPLETEGEFPLILAGLVLLVLVLAIAAVYYFSKKKKGKK